MPRQRGMRANNPTLSGKLSEKIRKFARDELQITAAEALDHIIILDKEVPLHELPRMYKGADAFVLPSRCDCGRGRSHPLVELRARCLRLCWCSQAPGKRGSCMCCSRTCGRACRTTRVPWSHVYIIRLR